jgi:hypothetical protein
MKREREKKLYAAGKKGKKSNYLRVYQQYQACIVSYTVLEENRRHLRRQACIYRYSKHVRYIYHINNKAFVYIASIQTTSTGIHLLSKSYFVRLVKIQQFSNNGRKWGKKCNTYTHNIQHTVGGDIHLE